MTFWCARNFARNSFLLPLCFQYFIKRIWIMMQHTIRNLRPIVLFHCCTTSLFACVNCRLYYCCIYDIFHDFWFTQNSARNLCIVISNISSNTFGCQSNIVVSNGGTSGMVAGGFVWQWWWGGRGRVGLGWVPSSMAVFCVCICICICDCICIFIYSICM